VRLVTERLVLREFTEADLASDLRPVGPGGDRPLQPFDLRDEASVRHHVRVALGNARQEPRDCFDLAILKRFDERLIGHGGFRLDDREPNTALVWCQTDPATWNQGLSHEASLAILGHCFGALGLHRLTGECHPKNLGARRLMERLGMRLEGTFVESSWQGGQWVDTALYGMLAREWKARAG
jgi:RimJ/RimL family protein N-acetyltransferase